MNLTTIDTVDVTGRWRDDIVGLRACAVLAVVIFHYDSNMLPAGFLGVDLFFVISGYLITQMLLSGWYLDSWYGVGVFLRRRFLRIFPTLIVAFPLFAIVFSFYALPHDHRIFFGTAIASLFGVANLILAWNAADYFAPAISLNPFLHSWSISLEDQFYLTYCVLLFMVSKYSGYALEKVIFGCTLIFIVLAYYHGPSTADFAFYSLSARFWEFLLGAVAFLCAFRIRPYHSVWLHVVCGVAFFFIFYSFYNLSWHTVSFWDYFLFCIAVAMVLVLGKGSKGWVHRFLCLSVVQAIGKISFSLYVFHFPLVKLYEYYFDTTGGVSIVFLSYLIATGMLSFINYQVVEKRFVAFYRSGVEPRLLNKVSRYWGGGAAISVVVILVAIISASLLSQNARYEVRLRAPLSQIANEDGNVELTIYGDSHAQSLYPLFRRLQQQYKIKIIDETGSACFLATDMVYQQQGVIIDRCQNHLKKSFQSVMDLSHQKQQTVFLGMRSLAYLSPALITRDRPVEGLWVGSRFVRNTGSALVTEYEASLRRMLAGFQEAGVKVIFMAPFPEVHTQTFACLIVPHKTDCRVSRHDNEDIRRPIMDSLYKLEREFDNLLIWDSFEIVCPDDYCYNIKDDRIIFRDDDHISYEMADKLWADFDQKIARQIFYNVSLGGM